MSQLPIHLTDDAPSSRQLTRAVQAQQEAELAVFEHHLKVRYLAECDRIDSRTLADVVEAALESEIAVCDWGLAQAAGSPAKAELVFRKVALLSQLNNARIARNFGG